MPWSARDGVSRLGPCIPKSDFWASAKEGVDQVGGVHTAQGFEFDYVGVIVGPDLVYRPMDGGWVGHRDQWPTTTSGSPQRRLRMNCRSPRRTSSLAPSRRRLASSRWRHEAFRGRSKG